jgi:hypothetical protein
MKKFVAILIVILSLFSLVACDLSQTVDEYSTMINSTLHGILDPYLKEDEKYQSGYVPNEADPQGADGYSLSQDPEN